MKLPTPAALDFVLVINDPAWPAVRITGLACGRVSPGAPSWFVEAVRNVAGAFWLKPELILAWDIDVLPAAESDGRSGHGEQPQANAGIDLTEPLLPESQHPNNHVHHAAHLWWRGRAEQYAIDDRPGLTALGTSPDFHATEESLLI
jgi:hypothetical protein